MDNLYSEINDLVVTIFKDILYIEEETLKRSTFENVTLTELHVIEAISLKSNRSMTEIANSLHITVGTLTTSVNNLVNKGFAKRLKDENDRRMVYIGLTHKGRVLYRLHDRFHRTMVEKIVKSLEGQEQQNLVHSLQKLSGFLYEFEQEILND